MAEEATVRHDALWLWLRGSGLPTLAWPGAQRPKSALGLRQGGQAGQASPRRFRTKIKVCVAARCAGVSAVGVGGRPGQARGVRSADGVRRAGGVGGGYKDAPRQRALRPARGEAETAHASSPAPSTQ